MNSFNCPIIHPSTPAFNQFFYFAVTSNTKLLVLWGHYWPTVPKKYFAVLACRWFLTLQTSWLTKISHIACFSLFMSTFLALFAYGMKILATCNHILRLTITRMVVFININIQNVWPINMALCLNNHSDSYLYIMTSADQRKSTSTQLPRYLGCSSLPSAAARVLYPVSCQHSLCLWWTTVWYSIKEHVRIANYIMEEIILLCIIWFHLYQANHFYLSCRKRGVKKGWLLTGTDSTNGQQCGNLYLHVL